MLEYAVPSTVPQLTLPFGECFTHLLKLKRSGAPGQLSPLSLQLLIRAQVVISWFMCHVGLHVGGTESAWNSLSPPLSVPPSEEKYQTFSVTPLLLSPTTPN